MQNSVLYLTPGNFVIQLRVQIYFFNQKIFIMNATVKTALVVLAVLIAYDMFVKGLISKKPATV